MIIDIQKNNICLRSILLSLAAVLIYICPLVAQPVSEHKHSQEIKAICTNNPLGGALVAVSVRTVPSGGFVMGTNERLLLHPASIQKLFATALALDSLGGSFRYETRLLRTGVIDQGILRGDLIIAGNGDPSFGSRFLDSTRPELVFADILRQLKSAGINSIDGTITAIPYQPAEHPVPDTWMWQDIANYYGAGPSGFCFMDNTYQLQVQTRGAASVAEITGAVPEMIELKFSSYATAQPINSDESYIFGAPFSAERQLWGELPLNRAMQIKGAMPQPEKVFARELSKYLSANGMLISGFSRNTPLPNTDLPQIGKLLSPSLSQLVQVTNKNSHNLFAEQLMLSITHEGEYIMHVDDMHKALILNVPDATTSMFFDASGLSPFNLTTADVFAQFLCSAANSRYSRDFESSLPVAGIDGTLKYWCRSNGLSRKVVAKTGSMTGVRSLAGFITAKDGCKYAFCIIVNNYTAEPADVKALMEKLLVLIYDNK